MWSFAPSLPNPQYFLHHSKKTGLDIWKRAIWKLQNKYQLRVCVINATINTLTEWLHRHKKIFFVCYSPFKYLLKKERYYQNSSLLFRHWYYNQIGCVLFCSTCQGVPKVRSSNFMRYNFWSKLLSFLHEVSKRCLLLYRVHVFRMSVTGMPPLIVCLSHSLKTLRHGVR